MRFAFVLGFFALLGVSCDPSSAEKSEDGFLIVCTTGILADAVSNMTESCEVAALMGPGTDPHLFRPSRKSLQLLERADIIIANGLHLEGRMQEVLEKTGMRKPVVFASDGLYKGSLITADDRNRTADPHFWTDVSMWKGACEHILSTLEKAEVPCVNRPAAEDYLSRLELLHEEIAEITGEIPPRKRVLITPHDAFSYYGRAYGLEVITLQGISTAAEYGVRDIRDVVQLITDREIPAVFDESSIAPRAMDAVTAGCESRGYRLKRGGTLYSDALGGAGSGAETYIDMMYSNATTIKSALK